MQEEEYQEEIRAILTSLYLLFSGLTLTATLMLADTPEAELEDPEVEPEPRLRPPLRRLQIGKIIKYEYSRFHEQ